jgi:hypothetical protein
MGYNRIKISWLRFESCIAARQCSTLLSRTKEAYHTNRSHWIPAFQRSVHTTCLTEWTDRHRVTGYEYSREARLDSRTATDLQYFSIRLVTFRDKYLKIGHFLFVTHLNRVLTTVTQQY